MNLIEWIGDGSGDLRQEMIAVENLYTNRKGTTPTYFMKTWTSDCQMISYGEITQELEILKQPNPHVISLIAFTSSLDRVQIVMEYATGGTMRERYFPSKVAEFGTLKLDNDYVIGSDEHKQFLRHVEKFFLGILAHLHKTLKRVYCDWKFDNILCIEENGAKFPRLKLTDFSSVQQNEIDIINPKNCNQLFTPLTLCGVLPKTCPVYKDDYKSVCYLMYKLNGKILPWENLSELPIINDFHYLTCAMLKNSQLFPIPTKQLVYWPSSYPFSYLNK